MGAEHLGWAAGAGGFIEDAHDADHGVGVVASEGHVFESGLVGFKFVVAAVFEAEEVSDDSGHLSAAVGADGGGSGEAGEEPLFCHLFGAVALDDVGDFVAENAGELPFGFEAVEEGTGDEDLAAGEGECVDGFGVFEKVELELVGAAASGSGVEEARADTVYDGCGLGAFLEAAVLGGHFGGGLEAEGDFLFGGETDALDFAGDGVGLSAAKIGDDSDDRHDEANEEAGVAPGSGAGHGLVLPPEGAFVLALIGPHGSSILTPEVPIRASQ